MPSQSHGTIAITARGNGSRWYGRVSIPAELARAAKLKEGVRVSTRSEGGVIIIRADDRGRIRFPPARGKTDPRHAFEAATATLGLKEVRLLQTVTRIDAVGCELHLHVPEGCIDENAGTAKAKPRKEPKPKPKTRAIPAPEGAPKVYGTAATVLTEARRAGKTVRTMTLEEIIADLSERGIDVQRQGPRFFRVNGKTCTASDLQDEINRLHGSTEHDRILLIMD